MRNNKALVIITCLLILLVVGFASVFTVHEGQRSLVLRLGKIVDTPKTGQAKLYNPGLHFKVPIINVVRRFDVRLQTLEAKSSRILTAEQKYVIVDYYAKWRISDLPLYYTRTSGNSQLAEQLIRQKINDSLRAEFGRRTINEVVSGGRGDIMSLLQKEANSNAQNLGVKVIDVRIKRIDLPTQVSQSVYSRMSAQREQVAAKHRADGQAAAEKIRAEADANVKVTVATAKAKGAAIRGQGDAQAAKTYAAAYKHDTSFYAFLRSLEAYTESFNNKSDVIVLNPKNQFFKYFNEADGKKTASNG